MQKEGKIFLNKDGIVVCMRREEDKVLYKDNVIVMPQLRQNFYSGRMIRWATRGLVKYAKGS